MEDATKSDELHNLVLEEILAILVSFLENTIKPIIVFEYKAIGLMKPDTLLSKAKVTICRDEQAECTLFLIVNHK